VKEIIAGQRSTGGILEKAPPSGTGGFWEGYKWKYYRSARLINELLSYSINTEHSHSRLHWKNIGGVTNKFKSGETAIWREIAHVTIIGSGSPIFSRFPKLDLDVLFVVLETAFKSS
jgi:hypothetical protein